MTKVSVVLAGLGVRGLHWADVLRRSPRCEITAFADPDSAAIERAVAEFGVRPTFSSAEEALEALPSVSALILANPPTGRESQVRAAAERNIPMLIEKPLALDLNEAEMLVKIAEDSNVPLMVGLNFRYLAVTQHAIGLLQQEVVGKPTFARFTYERYRDGHRANLNKYPLVMDHPMLWEQSIHHFDLMRFVYGQEPVLVQCQTWNPPWSRYDHDTNVAAIFKFDGGMVVNYQGTWQSNWIVPHFEWRTECTNGVIKQCDQFTDLFYAQHSDTDLSKVELPYHERWITETQGLLDAFIDTIVDGKPLECSGRDHLLSLAMVEACIESSQSGQGATIAQILSSSSNIA